MNIQRKLIFISAVAGIIAVFLPWFSISTGGVSQQINGFHGWGILVLLLFSVTGGSALTGNGSKPLRQNQRFLCLFSGAIVLLCVVIKITSFSGKPEVEIGMAEASVRVGVWLSIAACSAVFLFGWFFRSPEAFFKEAAEGLKDRISIPASLSDTGSNTGPDTTANKETMGKLRTLETVRRPTDKSPENET